ncbi:MAG: MOSC domain-containing protein [Parvularculaceae bacterium]
MRLLNFSVGRVQAIQIGSEVVKTAHIKAPSPEPWTITADGAEGDQRAVHPDKLYAFSRAAYEYWGEYLGIDPAKWPDGFFGENLTVDALDETDLRVGDIYAIGDKVKVVVAGARTPCVKLAWRLGQPRSFQRTFARSRHTGVYLGVIEAGVVHPDDAITRIHHDPQMPSVADVCDFIGKQEPPPLDALMRLLDCPYLSPANRLLLGAKREIAERAADAVSNRWRGWREFVISRIEDEARDIKSFYLSPKDGAALCQMRPGQYVTVRLTDENGETVTRTWSLSSFAHDPKAYRITVLRQEGAGSRGLHALKEGDSLELRAPSGVFALDMGSFRPLVLIGAGVGVTPLMAMLEAQLKKKEPGYIHFIYGAKSPEDMAFRDRLSQLAAEHPTLRTTFVFSRKAEEGMPTSRITADLVKRVLHDVHVVIGGKTIALPWFEADFYLCGPGAFCEQMTAALVAGGADPNHMFSERFEALEAEASELQSATVRFAKAEKEAAWKADSNPSLLELAESAGLSVDNDCRSGACMTCRSAIAEGETTADLGDGTALLCIARPKTPRLVIDI